ncbi:MAG: ADP-ribose pyrophosphatase [Cellvibrionaceae bacterium]|jgi:ADP-ribose pyrophosphatase
MSSQKKQKSSFVHKDVEVIGREIVYQGFFKMKKLQLRHRLFEGGWTPTITREVFVRGQAVAAVMYDPDNHLIGLIEQFRVGALSKFTLGEVALDDSVVGAPSTVVVDDALQATTLNDTTTVTRSFQKEGNAQVNSPWLYEVVAGMTEPGEAPEDVILRELLEEAGMAPVKLMPICQYFTSPGGTDETLVLFCALGDLTQVEGVHGLPGEHEDIRVLILPEQDVFDDLYDGRFNNAATLICLQWLCLNKDKIKAID